MVNHNLASERTGCSSLGALSGPVGPVERGTDDSGCAWLNSICMYISGSIYIARGINMQLRVFGCRCMAASNAR